MKQNIFTKLVGLNGLLSLVFAVAIFVFFGFYYPFHLNYQEQFQLFLFTPDYFFDFANHPGGVADYIGKFFTQFYFYSKIGAFILAVLLVGLQRLIYSLAKKLGAASHWAPLTFIPSILFWNLLCNENYLLGGLIAMILLALFSAIYLHFKSENIQTIVGFILLIALYWIAGGVHLFFALFMLAVKLTSELKPGKKDLIRAGGLMTLALLLPYLAKAVVLQYPMMKFLVGTTYFRYPVNVPSAVALIALLILIAPFVMRFLSTKFNMKKVGVLLTVQLIILTFFGVGFIGSSADFSKEEVMAYDFHVRMRKWDRVIALADKNAPTSPLSVTCLNLALAKQDLLGERMFSYYQNGMGGLIPDFTRDFTIPLMAGEVYYHLGLINTAQRFAFEAMEALPDYQKSARAIKRLAETNIINGEYVLAKKYLHLLQKTFYYRSWANVALEIVTDEKQIENHLEWGWLRKTRIQKDFLFSEQEKESMIGQLFTHNPNNRMAFEYLLACSLVKKDLQSFIKYFPLSTSLNYTVIPQHFQEALLFVWQVTNKDNNKQIPYPISGLTQSRLATYKTQYGKTKNAELMKKDFSDTYWYYLHF